MRFEVVDLVIASLRDSKGHRGLATNFEVMLKALHSFDKGSSRQTKKERLDQTAHERILLRMLVAAAKQEVKTTGDDDIASYLDPDLLAAQNAEYRSLEIQKKKKEGSASREQLSVALLKELPGLMSRFKSDTAILRSLTCLPQYLSK